ncbi:MAG: CxxxxCH/CxxCH domain-containing protein [Rikenellaceae bacterium]|nr:CxxxxCH/CxxCH domain-containing protein [Rikenellaceae bacterium]
MPSSPPTDQRLHTCAAVFCHSTGARSPGTEV